MIRAGVTTRATISALVIKDLPISKISGEILTNDWAAFLAVAARVVAKALRQCHRVSWGVGLA
ncbi:hypothetical protein GCM10027046_15660 [Uliginosibacterium flavum]